MADYGHPLTFGSFLTPSAATPHRAVELAVLCERVGLDIATFQDHPYQPSFHDTWTLISFIAAQTSTIRLAANVTNLPLRPPAVLARSLASLDLLSGGRIELGLGAGAFWEAIEAMGGGRRSPAEAVEALEEAIDVIEQVWDVGARGGVRVIGQHYRVVGAKRGPAPAHDIEIWLGAYKPRMLALLGRRAAGWLPSLSYLQPGDLAAGNARIDDGALQAGRSPHEIRRLLNISGQFLPRGRAFLQGPGEQWAEELADLALTEGLSTFLLASDDPDDVRQFAAEVAPAVRELVAAERSTPTTAATAPAAPAVTLERVHQAPATATVGTSLGVTPTPPPAPRGSVEVWDEATRPSGPAPDPNRRYTAGEQATGQHLVDIHNHLRAELDQVYDLIAQVEAGTATAGAARSHINTMTMRQNKWVLGGYCVSYCRVVTTHHTVEDRAMFPQLRAADRRLDPVIDRLELEHRVIHDVLEGVDRALVAYVGAPDGMAELRAAVDLLGDSLLSHLSYEERELVEPLARLGIG